jgi:hypothetical protein
MARTSLRTSLRTSQPTRVFETHQELPRRAVEGAPYCVNDGCEVVGHREDFKVCPQCKIARYCSDACQKQDWSEHKATCGTTAGLLSKYFTTASLLSMKARLKGRARA